MNLSAKFSQRISLLAGHSRQPMFRPSAPPTRCALAILILCFVIARYAGAQETVTLSGFVRDAQSGETITGASVYVPERKKGAVANPYGFYSLSVPRGATLITIRSLGYRTLEQRLTLTRDTTIEFRLTPQAVLTEEVVVSAEKDNANVRNVEMSVARLDMKTIEQMPVVFGEADPLKAIQLLPGVSNTGENSSGFNVRGGSADQNLVLLDEAMVFNASHLFGFFSVFNPDAVKDVTLYKGAIPARYGGRLSSVLDVRQKEGSLQKINAKLGLGLISSKGLVEGPLGGEKGSFMIAGRRTYADIFLGLSSDPEIKNNTAFFYDVNLKANYSLDANDRIFVSGYLGRDKFAVDQEFGSSWGNATATARWNHIFSDHLFSNFSAVYGSYDYALNFFTPGAEFEWSSTIRNYNLKADFSWFQGDDHIDFGANAIYYDINAGSIQPLNSSAIVPTSLGEQNALETAAYINHNLELSERFSVEYGLRYSAFFRYGPQTIYTYANDRPAVYNAALGRYEDGEIIDSVRYGAGDLIESFQGLEPRLAARFALNDNASIKASYARTNQYLHLISNSTSPSPLDIWSPSGPYKKPQIADQVALGYFTNFDDNAYELSVEGYYKSMRDLVDYVNGADLLLNKTLETELLQGKGRAYGMELMLRKTSGRLTGWISYTLSRAERRINGIDANDPGINNGEYYPTNYDKTHDASLTAIYKLNDVWTISGNFVYATGRPTTYPEGRYEYTGLIVPHYENRNQRRMPDYHRLDISVTLQGARGDSFESDWTFGIYNLYNRQNAESIFFRQNEDDPTVTEAVKLTLFGIVPSISYTMRF